MQPSMEKCRESSKVIPLDQAHDEAMPLVECALTSEGHCKPLEV